MRVINLCFILAFKLADFARLLLRRRRDFMRGPDWKIRSAAERWKNS